MAYTDQSFLRSYHDARANKPWAEASEEDRQQAAATAAAWIDKTFGEGFGLVAGPFDGEVPTEVLFAEAEAALAALTKGEIAAAVEAYVPLPAVPAEAEGHHAEDSKPNSARRSRG